MQWLPVFGSFAPSVSARELRDARARHEATLRATFLRVDLEAAEAERVRAAAALRAQITPRTSADLMAVITRLAKLHRDCYTAWETALGARPGSINNETDLALALATRRLELGM